MNLRAGYEVALASLIFLLAGPICSRQPSASEMTATSARLFYLSTSSDFAVLGKVIDTRGIGKRLSQEELRNLDDLGKTLGGTVYTVQVEDVVIRRANFGIGGSQPRAVRGKIQVFKRRDGPYSPNELYVKGQRYLIFLSTPDQVTLGNRYLLDKGQVYYQAFEPDQGIVRITSLREPFLIELRQLGEAVRPSDPRQKLQRLKVLLRSTEPELRKSANEAIKLIEQTHRK